MPDATFRGNVSRTGQSIQRFPATLFHGQVTGTTRVGERIQCSLAGAPPILLPISFASHVRIGDILRFPIPDNSGLPETQIHAIPSESGRFEIVRAFINYVTQPKCDKHNRTFVSSLTSATELGIRAIHLRSSTIRDYFYTVDRNARPGGNLTFYELLHVSNDISPAELRLAYQVSSLETDNPMLVRQIERAFNILAQPKLRSCYDSLLLDPSSPAIFPYAGSGTLLVAGNRSNDGTVFFAARVLSFVPLQKIRHFSVPFRKLVFYADHARYKDSRTGIEVLLDRATMPLKWDDTWNQWAKFVEGRVSVYGHFVQGSRYKQREGQFDLLPREIALPSRLRVRLPPDILEQLEEAQRKFHDLGRFADAVKQLRAMVEDHPIESNELRRLSREAGLPADFNPSLVNWQPSYDSFYYQQLSARALHLYLFRNEYIFFTPRGLAVEIPCRGHATYLFARPEKIEEFLALYVRTTKEEIRRNAKGVAEELRFVCRIVHGHNRQKWLRELNDHIGTGIHGAPAS